MAADWIPVEPPAGATGMRRDVPVRLAIAADTAHRRDARYLEAALTALAERHGDSVVVDSVGAPAPGGWLFWLRDDGVPDRILAAVERGATLFQLTPPGPAVPPTRLALGAGPSDHRVVLHHRGADSLPGHPLWRDGGGRPVLTVARLGDGRRLRLAGRLDPTWSDLVLLPSFPVALERLIHGAPPVPPGRVTLAQALPRTVERRVSHPAGASLVRPLWILAVILFLADRVIALRRSAG
jgi:hypothetical protein